MSLQVDTRNTPFVCSVTIPAVILGFLALAMADLIMRFGGFRRLHQTVRSWPVSQKKGDMDAVIQAVCTSVDRAATYYPNHALCLQRSAVITCLLRRKGVPAEMVIGCRKIPFRGHAWVEVSGQVVNDTPKVKMHYRVLERC
jgi:hypothetical protein